MTSPTPNSRRPNPKVARSKTRNISDAEWTVMNVLWTGGPLTANQVVESLSAHTDWKPKTIHTLLRRLVQKGALSFEKQGREHLFKAHVDAKKVRHAASRSFLQRLFNGELAPFLACFLEQEKLSAAEIKELKQILDSSKP